MSWSDFFLLCFSIGSLWTLAAVVLGGLHFGHGAHGVHAHGTAHHSGHLGHLNGRSGPSAAAENIVRGSSQEVLGSWLGSMLNPSCAAVFLAWFGGVGYLLTRHSGFAFLTDLVVACLVGLCGAGLLTAFLRLIQAHEKPLDPAEYEMVGVLGRVTSTIRPDGVGELIYVRDGARRPAAARSEDGTHIARGEEVIVTRYEKGLAYVRTWEAMTQRGQSAALPEALTKEKEDVK